MLTPYPPMPALPPPPYGQPFSAPGPYVSDGQPANATSVDIPLDVLRQRTDSLYDRINNLLRGASLILQGGQVPLGQAIIPGMAVWMDANYNFQPAVFSAAYNNGVVSYPAAALPVGLIAQKTQNTQADIVTHGPMILTGAQLAAASIGGLGATSQTYAGQVLYLTDSTNVLDAGKLTAQTTVNATVIGTLSGPTAYDDTGAPLYTIFVDIQWRSGLETFTPHRTRLSSTYLPANAGMYTDTTSQGWTDMNAFAAWAAINAPTDPRYVGRPMYGSKNAASWLYIDNVAASDYNTNRPLMNTSSATMLLEGIEADTQTPIVAAPQFVTDWPQAVINAGGIYWMDGVNNPANSLYTISTGIVTGAAGLSVGGQFAGFVTPGATSDTYTVVVAQGSTGLNPQTMILNITTGSGTDNVTGLVPSSTSFGTAFPFGQLGLLMDFHEWTTDIPAGTSWTIQIVGSTSTQDLPSNHPRIDLVYARQTVTTATQVVTSLFAADASLTIVNPAGQAASTGPLFAKLNLTAVQAKTVGDAAAVAGTAVKTVQGGICTVDDVVDSIRTDTPFYVQISGLPRTPVDDPSQIDPLTGQPLKVVRPGVRGPVTISVIPPTPAYEIDAKAIASLSSGGVVMDAAIACSGTSGPLTLVGHRMSPNNVLGLKARLPSDASPTARCTARLYLTVMVANTSSTSAIAPLQLSYLVRPTDQPGQNAGVQTPIGLSNYTQIAWTTGNGPLALAPNTRVALISVDIPGQVFGEIVQFLVQRVDNLADDIYVMDPWVQLVKTSQ